MGVHGKVQAKRANKQSWASGKDLEAQVTELREVYGDKVRRLLMRIIRHEDEVEDVHQEVWLKIWRSLQYFRGDCEIGTWIYRVAFTYALMCLRSRKIKIAPWQLEHSEEEKRAMIGECYQSSSDALIDRLHAETLLSELAGYMSRMSKRDQKLIKIMLLSEGSAREAAKQLGISVFAAKSRIHRIKLLLKDTPVKRMMDLAA